MSESIAETNRTSSLFASSWVVALAINFVIVGYFGYAFYGPTSVVKASLLPGMTTHGHYQIELDCDACHQTSQDDAEHSSRNLMQDACLRCHGDQLKLANDTHPAKKFNDPTNAELLRTLDAQNCLTCHREHIPDQTLASGLTVPSDYCWHCHQDVADNRPSHQGMAFDSCATAGCHNYHDNRALYGKYLNEHFGEPDFLGRSTQPLRNFAEQWKSKHVRMSGLAIAGHDAPVGHDGDSQIRIQWAEMAHAAAGVNCSHCHQPDGSSWNDEVAMGTCGDCHHRQTDSFVTGRHGMRLAVGMTPMTPAMARLPMHADTAHKQLACNTCHPAHRYDTQFAAVTACLGCHADSHSLAYSSSSHAGLWRDEQNGKLPAGSGVTCATCHMPRMSEGNSIWVNHDQNANLRPRETMAREVCSHCHGLEFSLSSLSDPSSAATCFSVPPKQRIHSVEMAHQYFSERERVRQRRAQNKQRENSK
tara:strand:+ start:468829 stop:470256 length:1428 start_codon:yes stop_codon:yes gene_type:complete